MACKDKRKVWVDVKGHERRVLKCVNKTKKANKLKVKLPGIEKRRARQATPPRSKRISPHRKTPRKELGVALERLTPHKKRVKPTYDDEPLNDIKRIRE